MTYHWMAHAIYILESIEKVQEAVAKGEEFWREELVYGGILRLLHTLFESAHQMPDDIKARHQAVDWKEISRLRNILVHDYLGDLYNDEVANYIDTYLPPLQAAMRHHMPDWKALKQKMTVPDDSQHANHDTDGGNDGQAV